MSGFVHLRCHTAYSLSEGAIPPASLAALAAANGMPAVGMADSGNLFGALEFSQYASGKGVQPVIGCQITVETQEASPAWAEPVVLLAQTAEGIAGLQRLSSLGFIHADPAAPRVGLRTVLDHAAGLFLLTGGAHGPLGRRLAAGEEAGARHLAASLAEAFPGRIAIELQRHGLSIETAVEPGLVALADDLRLPLVATNECFFATEAMHEAHDALLCIAAGRTLSETDRRRVTKDHWFKPPAAMRALFADLADACDNTLAIARACAAMVESRKPLLPICPKLREGQTEEQTLRAMAEEGLVRRFAQSAIPAERHRDYGERLAYELDVIMRMGFAGYFLIVADFIQWAKANDIPVGPGRGSGAGSVAAWALTITDLDPIRFGLLFERFLNPERISMPDFDIDFCQDRRDEVIAYVRREYGAERVGQIITFGKLQARAAVRDVGRVLGMPFGQVNKVAELIPNNPAKPVTLQEAVNGEARLQQMRDADEAIRRLLEIALQLEGLYRHASTHAAGVVIGDRPLIDLVPLYRDPKTDTLVTQYNMKYVEQAGLVKFDFLGLTTLTILQRATILLHRLGITVDLARLPLDDRPTYEMLGRGDAGGVFQFESQGMRDVLRQMRPDRFEDLVAAVALYRPGPMANIPAYCRRKHGESWEPPHPQLHDILAETYGIMVYQEQVMQIAQTMAGYSLGAADMLRRAMGKKIRAEMETQRQTFVEGAVSRGIDHAKSVEVFELMAKFADYGFNKSHAAAYALVAYQTAWLKANHPVAFLAACMSLALTNTDKLAALRQESQRLGIKVLPPDINRSGADFTVETLPNGDGAIRYALAGVKKVGAAAMAGVTEARGNRPFRDVTDFATRVPSQHLNRMQLEGLVKAGAFDGLEGNRARLFGGVDAIIRRSQARAEDLATGQAGLFGTSRQEPIRLPDLPDWPQIERLGYEAEAVGFHLTAHPLDAYRSVLSKLGVIAASQVETKALAGITRVKIAGSLVATKERTTRNNTRMCWARISDATGSVEVTLFSEVLARSRELLASGAVLLVTADLRVDGESVRITASEVASLDAVAAQTRAAMRIWIAGKQAIPPIQSLLARQGAGRGRVSLVPRLPSGQDIEIALPGAFRVTPQLSQALKVVSGVERIEEG